MYTPKFIKKEFQYTRGDEYMIAGEPYIGYYNVTVKGAYTDKVYSGRSSRLYPIEFVLNKQSQIYSELADNRGVITDLEFDDPLYFRPTVSEEDSRRGYITRYFIKQRNDMNGVIREVDKEQFELLSDQSAGLNPNFYKSVSLRWKITGPREDILKDGIIFTSGVIGTNNRTLIEKDNILKGIFDKLAIRLDQFSLYDNSLNTNTDIQL